MKVIKMASHARRRHQAAIHVSGHKHTQYRIGCALTGDDAFVIGGSEDGKVKFYERVHHG